MDSQALETITKNNFWQVIHDNQKGKYYRTRETLLDELKIDPDFGKEVRLNKTLTVHLKGQLKPTSAHTQEKDGENYNRQSVHALQIKNI